MQKIILALILAFISINSFADSPDNNQTANNEDYCAIIQNEIDQIKISKPIRAKIEELMQRKTNLCVKTIKQLPEIDTYVECNLIKSDAQFLGIGATKEYDFCSKLNKCRKDQVTAEIQAYANFIPGRQADLVQALNSAYSENVDCEIKTKADYYNK